MGIEHEIVTVGDIQELFKKTSEKLMMESVEKKIKESIEDSKIKTGTVLKFYQFFDKAKVRLDDGNIVMCKILHRCVGSCTDLYTPLGESKLDDELKERCIIPEGELDCLVVDINSKDKDWLLLGYYVKRDFFVDEPASVGEYKVSFIGTGANNESIGVGVGSPKFYTKGDVDELLQDLWDELELLQSQLDSRIKKIWDFLGEEEPT